MSTTLRGDTPTARALIPGAYERRPPARRQPGSMGGPAFGSENPAIGPGTMDATTLAERRKEGGGGANQRRHGGAAAAQDQGHA